MNELMSSLTPLEIRDLLAVEMMNPGTLPTEVVSALVEAAHKAARLVRHLENCLILPSAKQE